MPWLVSNLGAVAARVLRQLRRDPRFLGFSLLIPVAVVTMLFLFFDGVSNPIFDPDKFIVPIGAFLVHFITYVLCAIAVVRERTSGTLNRMFINGYRPIEIIGGYILAYSGLALAQSLIVLFGLSTLFQLNYSAEIFAALFVIFWLLAIISIALGILVSNFARNEGQVIPFIPLVILLSVLFSGMLLPLERLPEWSRGVALVTPMYYTNLVVQALIKPNAASVETVALAGLIGYGAVVILLAALTLRDTE